MSRKALGLSQVLLVLAALMGSAVSQSVCSVNNDLVPPSCSTADGWSSGVVCGHKTITCQPSTPTVSSLGITYGVLTPAAPKGTIVLFSNSGGTTLDAETQFGTDYYNAGYQVVETQWDSDWEDTGGTANIAYAAGRPSAFLNWVRYGSPFGGTGLWTTGGMCVHGVSAGSAAAVYVLAWYGGGCRALA